METVFKCEVLEAWDVPTEPALEKDKDKYYYAVGMFATRPNNTRVGRVALFTYGAVIRRVALHK